MGARVRERRVKVGAEYDPSMLHALSDSLRM
jgi:hypothetical protein